MKQSELKRILKPLIKECIKEVIFEDGILSGIIAEVVQGMGAAPLLREATHVEIPQEAPELRSSEPDPELAKSLEERRQRLEESMGSQFKGILQETQPLSRGGSLGESKTRSPLSNYAPDDPGVDISGIMKVGGGKKWKHMI